MILSLKPDVKLDGLTPQMALGCFIVASVFWSFRATCTVTSANDGKHGPNSLHSRNGLCRACDFRTKDFAGDKLALVTAIRDALGRDFDVVLEDIGGENEHLHAEYDPK